MTSENPMQNPVGGAVRIFSEIYINSRGRRGYAGGRHYKRRDPGTGEFGRPKGPRFIIPPRFPQSVAKYHWYYRDRHHRLSTTQHGIMFFQPKNIAKKNRMMMIICPDNLCWSNESLTKNKQTWKTCFCPETHKTWIPHPLLLSNKWIQFLQHLLLHTCPFPFLVVRRI